MGSKIEFVCVLTEKEKAALGEQLKVGWIFYKLSGG